MNKKLLKPLIVVLMLVLGSLSSFSYYLIHYRPLKVPVVTHTINQRCQITYDDVAYVELPKELLNSEIVMSEDEFVGFYVKTDYTIPEGSFIYRDSIIASDQRKDEIVYGLKKDEITYDLMTRDISVNSAYLSNDMLCDIYATIRREKIVSDLLISDCRIIALYNVNGVQLGPNDKNTTVGTITLAIDKNSVPYLNRALASGTLRLCVADDPYGDRNCRLVDDSAIIEMLD